MKTMMAGLAGLLFGIGLVVADMTNPAKVRAFLDIGGNWDPSLAIVMVTALLVPGIGYRLVFKRDKPLFAPTFQTPTNTALDARLLIGAGLFGVGWGLVGLCPGPAIAALSFGGWPVLGFFAAMAAGMGLYAMVEDQIAKVV